jgi:hypothetical protein
MLNYKPLDLEYKHVSEKILNYITESKMDLQSVQFWHTVDVEHFLKTIPELQEMFDPMNLTVVDIGILYTQETSGVIHVDTGPENSRINIPILNCENAVTNFYENHGETLLKYTPNGISYDYIDPNSCTLIEQYTTTQPTVIRVDIPHQVNVINPALPRIVCTVFFDENIDYLLEN